MDAPGGVDVVVYGLGDGPVSLVEIGGGRGDFDGFGGVVIYGGEFEFGEVEVAVVGLAAWAVVGEGFIGEDFQADGGDFFERRRGGDGVGVFFRGGAGGEEGEVGLFD